MKEVYAFFTPPPLTTWQVIILLLDELLSRALQVGELQSEVMALLDPSSYFLLMVILFPIGENNS